MASITITSDLDIKLRVTCDVTKSGNLQLESGIDLNLLKEFLDNISDSHTFCFGISCEEFRTECPGIRYVPKCFVLQTYPFDRYISKKCKKWFRWTTQSSRDRKLGREGDARCTSCNVVYGGVRNRNIKELPKLTQKARLARTEATSKFPMTLLSPRGVKRKMHNMTLEKKKRQRQISSLSEKLRRATEVTLDEDQSEELTRFVHKVSERELDDALSGQDPASEEALKEAFQHDQKRNSMYIYSIHLTHSFSCKQSNQKSAIKTNGI